MVKNSLEELWKKELSQKIHFFDIFLSPDPCKLELNSEGLRSDTKEKKGGKKDG